MEGINIRISDEMREGLRLLAKKERRRPSDLVRIIIEDYLGSRFAEIKDLRVAEKQAEQRISRELTALSEMSHVKDPKPEVKP